jgi:hypothetical protein
VSDLRYKPTLTVVDVIESGACMNGVCEWVEAHGGRIAGKTRTHWKRPELIKASNADAYGSGYGYGSGSGSGSGYGDGDGGDS